MNSQIGKYERALSTWRNAQAVVELLEEFQARGGEHRLRIEADDNHVVTNALNSLLEESRGYAVLLSVATKRAQTEAERARLAFLEEAGGDHLAESLKVTG